MGKLFNIITLYVIYIFNIFYTFQIYVFKTIIILGTLNVVLRFVCVFYCTGCCVDDAGAELIEIQNT